MWGVKRNILRLSFCRITARVKGYNLSLLFSYPVSTPTFTIYCTCKIKSCSSRFNFNKCKDMKFFFADKGFQYKKV